MIRWIRHLREYISLPVAARQEWRFDRSGLPAVDPGPQRVILASIEWLSHAQDSSEPPDDGVARHYSFATGWSASYPETTGYIVPTLLEQARLLRRPDLVGRARRMVDWLTAVQFPVGGVPGGTVGARPWEPVVFNTGQVLLGFAAAIDEFGADYVDPAKRAVQWLVDAQDDDGAWRRFESPFRAPGEKAYYTHVAWGLLEAARVGVDTGRAEHFARKHLQWAMTLQRPNGWIERCCLNDPQKPLTHTLGYTLRGFIEGYRYFSDDSMLEAASRLADPLLAALQEDGFLAGRFDASWRPRAEWSCLTGTAQVAICWFLIGRLTGDQRYIHGAKLANSFVRRTIRLSGPADVVGGVKGSYPFWGDYGRYELLNWAAKFTIDSNQLELEADGVSTVMDSERSNPESQA
jgi:hypothetical protein